MKKNFLAIITAIIIFLPNQVKADYDNCEDEVINGTSYCTRWNDGGSIYTGECSCSSVGDALLGLAAAGVIYWAVTSMTNDENEETALVSFDNKNPFQLNYNGLPDWAYLNLNFSPVNTINNQTFGNAQSFKAGKNGAIIQINAGAKFK